MIENAITHAIVMNLIIQSVGTAIMDTINWLKAFFLAPYAGSILVAILILATIFVGWWTKRMHKRSDFYNRFQQIYDKLLICLLYTSPSPRDQRGSRMPSSA